MRLARVLVVARFELRVAVTRASFLITTFGMPLLLGLVTLASFAVQHEALVRPTAPVALGWVDGTASIAGELAPTPSERFVRFPDRARGLEALREGSIAALFVLAPDYFATGAIDEYTLGPIDLLDPGAAHAGEALGTALARHLLEGRVAREVLARALDPARVRHVTVTARGLEPDGPGAGAKALLSLAFPFFLGVLLLSALLVASGYLVQTVGQDKETKIVEVLLSSVRPAELLAGKLLGLGAAGLLQFGVWAAGTIVAALLALASLPGASMALPWQALVAAPPFFVLGYVFLGSLMLATGSLGANAAEAQKLTVGWVLLALVPLVAMVGLLEDPHGTLAHVLTFVPTCTTLTVVVRLAVDPDGMPAWEVLLAGVDLALSTAAAIYVGARLFRIGLLLSGERPSLRALLRQSL